MNAAPKAVIQARLKALNMTRAQLATQLRITPTTLGSTLSSPMLQPEGYWPAILDVLGLEVVIRPRQS